MDRGNYYYRLFLRGLLMLMEDEAYCEREDFSFSEYVSAKEWLAEVYMNSERYKDRKVKIDVEKCNDSPV